jgi:hypothetical protein
LIKEGILKGADRKEESWKKIKFNEPFKEALDRFREEVLGRDDFDPTSLLQFGLFMSKAVINVLKEAEERFGIDGQKMVNDALVKTGYNVGKEILEGVKVPEKMTDIDFVSYYATIINTQAWTSIEDPRIENNDECSFDIFWCPLQDIYSAFDCRVQRYLVQGLTDVLREKYSNSDFQIAFKSTIPAGAETCKFTFTRKKPGEPDYWELYSRILEKKAMDRMKQRKLKNEKKL